MSETQPEGSLRERKKAKTRAAIQHEALRLFSEQGYGATTIEQIVDAVEVSQSTFFRYFPAKEDLVLTDDYDPIIIEAIRTQPPDLGPIEAVRRGLRAVFDPLSDEERADMRGRAELALSVPELRGATLDQFAQTIRQITDVIAERAGRTADDFAVQTLAGAILGVMISAEFHWVEHHETDLIALLDEALRQLEDGLRL
ncbi:MAG: TetR family transcriptional regulator [Acidimicrobiales bacterium]